MAGPWCERGMGQEEGWKQGSWGCDPLRKVEESQVKKGSIRDTGNGQGGYNIRWLLAPPGQAVEDEEARLSLDFGWAPGWRISL